MPTPYRFARSLVALALVVNIVAAGAPGAALGGQPADAATAAAGTGAALDDGRGASPLGAPRTVRSDKPVVDAATGAGLAPRAPWIDRPAPAAPEPKARSVSAVAPSSGSGTGSSRFQGRNHVWIPALGVDRSVSFFACTSKAYPGDRVYRWGCAGGNNVYLFGHAYSVFKPLHDAYVRGRLAKGMQVHYADDNGRVTTYAVSWWKVTTPDKSAWAYAAQSSPSLTLQTCVGSRSQYRLIVRLAKVG